MAERRLYGVLQCLHALAAAGHDASTDAELLGRFVAHRDAAAFETLVRRHGPTVWGVCCRVLRDANDAEDAFQAAFLVLVRKAASIAGRELLGNWLYGVAYRTALEARAAAAKRRAKEREAGAMPKDDASRPEAWREALPLLDRELARLPDKYRTPILLCDLQGESRRDAARRLRLPEGTLSSRLARGRVLLAKRLSRHGLAISGGALAAALAADTASAGVPPLLTAATVRAALSFAAGTAASVPVAALTEGVLKAMLWTKLKIATAMLMTAGLLAAGAAVTAFRPQPARAAEAVIALKTKPPIAGDKEPSAEPDKKPTIPAGGDHDDYKAAVARGVRWLALHQAPDGHWSLDEFQKFAHKEPTPDSRTFTDACTGQAITKNDVAATAFALLPFLGAGYTHKAPKEKTDVDYSKTVKAGIDWLVAQQEKDGAFDAKSVYANALAAIAVCEAYGLTADSTLKDPSQKALNYIEAAQDPTGGGWRYSPRQAGDLSVTGWQLTALKSGQTAGLDVDKKVLKKAERFLVSCETKADGYSYMPAGQGTPTMTAVGMVCRERFGVNPRNVVLLNGAEILKAAPPGKAGNIYYDYYATQAMFHLGGDAWKFWDQGPDGKNGVRDVLLAAQEHDPKRPAESGSWTPIGPWKEAGGRVMQTSLSLLILEVYYRQLPLFRRDDGAPKEKE